jgi:hypothetical protein
VSAVPDDPLDKEFSYFVEHQDELAAKYAGKVLVIVGEDVVGVFGSEIEAVRGMEGKHALGTFLIQRCELGPDCYTVHYYGFHMVPAAA